LAVKGPVITNKVPFLPLSLGVLCSLNRVRSFLQVYFDVEHGGKPLGRVTMGCEYHTIYTRHCTRRATRDRLIFPSSPSLHFLLPRRQCTVKPFLKPSRTSELSLLVKTVSDTKVQLSSEFPQLLPLMCESVK
jgi:hypothetical protein